MSTMFDLDRELAARFEARATTRAPEGLLEGALERVATKRQRPRWLAAERMRSMTATTLTTRPTMRVAWILAVLGLLIAALVIAALLAGAGHHGLPHNGLVTFAKDGQVYTLSNDQAVALTHDADRKAAISWSPDGSRAALFSTDAHGVVTVRLLSPDGTLSTLPLTFPVHPTFGDSEVLAWSPDGTRLAFATKATGEPNDAGPSTIHVVDASSGAASTFDPGSRFVGADSPAWSHDGRSIAFRGTTQLSPPIHDLAVAPVAGGPSTVLVPRLPDGFDVVGYGYPIWSPDDRSLVFDAVDTNVGNGPLFRVYRVGADGRNLAQLTAAPRNGYAPRVSPDGKWIAFTDWQNPVGSLWVMHNDGSGQRELIDHTVSDSMQWSPDSTAILIEGQPANGHDNSIWSIHPDGSGKTLLLSAPTAANARSGISWQPQP